MTMRARISMPILVALLAAVALLTLGCGGSSTVRVFQNVSERTSWGATDKIAFASFGANGQLYVYSINDNGTAMFLMTPSDNDNDFADEGGHHPAFSPAAGKLVIASRRGQSEALYVIDAVRGDRDGLVAITDPAASGSDNQPSYYPDGDSIIFTSTRRAGNADIYTIAVPAAAKADARTAVVTTDAEETWAAVSPDGTKVAYTSDTNGNTDIWVKDLGTDATDPGTCLTADSPYRDEAPSWSPNGEKIAFHSDRNGDFDIWLMDADGATQVAVTGDQRSDGFPVFGPDGDRLAITRDREIWTVPAKPWTEWRADADTEADQVTRRF